MQAGWVHDERSALAWIGGILRFGLCALDGPIVYRTHQGFARSDAAALEAWNEYLAASRESAELALEDTQMGAALVRVLRSTGELGDGDVLPEATSYVTAFAIACARSAIGAREAVLGFLWANAESQTSAAVRLVPLGQTVGAHGRCAVKGAARAHHAGACAARSRAGASLEVMVRDARAQRGQRPFLFTNLKAGDGVEQIVRFIEQQGLMVDESAAKTQA